VGLFLMGLLSYGVLRGIKNAREAARSTACKGSIYFLGSALRRYHEVQGSFPPAYVSDANGKPLFSWRVLLAPYCDRNEFFERYNREVPWNAEENFKLAQDKNFVYLYACPSGSKYQDPRDEDFDPKQPCMTNYVAVVGPETAFPGGGKSVSLEEITDGPENTILLVEIANSDIHWSEPRDLDFAEMSFKINDPLKPSVSSPHSDGPNVVFADGRSCRVSETMPPEILRALFTINGGEKFSRYELEKQGFLR
jgi:prepilin-type processing-associated H-X9-DG protein